jgi:hypothetical protein
MDTYIAKLTEIRAYIADQLTRTDHTFESDENAIQQIRAITKEFVQCTNALPPDIRNREDFENAADAAWYSAYEFENLFVLSQTYAKIDGDDVYPQGFVSLIEDFKNLVIAQQLAEMGGATAAEGLDSRITVHARRVRLLCIYLLRRVQTNDARNLYGFARVVELKETVDLLLGPLPDEQNVDIEASAVADVSLMRLLVDVIRHISRVYLERFNEDIVNDVDSPRVGARRAFFVNYTHLNAFKRRLKATPPTDVSLASDIDVGICETRIDQTTLSEYQEFLRMLELLKTDFHKHSHDVYFLNQHGLTRLSSPSRTARDVERRALCDKFKQLRAAVVFVTRKTNEGRMFYHEQLAREVERDLLMPIKYAIEQLRCD